MISIIPRPSREMKKTSGWERCLKAPLTLTGTLSATDRQLVILPSLFPLTAKGATAATHLRPKPITGMEGCSNNSAHSRGSFLQMQLVVKSMSLLFLSVILGITIKITAVLNSDFVMFLNQKITHTCTVLFLMFALA